MQSTNAAQGGSAWYNIYLNDEDDATVFFTEGDNSDDWTDIGTEGPLGQVRDVGTIDENSFDILSDWVGYGDESDYAKFTLDNAAKLSFSIDADGMAKFTVYQLIRGKDGTYSLKALQSTALSYDKEFEEYAANTKPRRAAAPGTTSTSTKRTTPAISSWTGTIRTTGPTS